jgi:hypothetical protein
VHWSGIRPGAVRVSSPHRNPPAAVLHQRSINCDALRAMQFARVYYSPKDSTQVKAGDLFFARGKPLLVISWRRKDGERVPDECVELDPAKLQSASSNGTIYRYEGKVGP